MPAASVNVVISATDRVTAKVDAINKRLAAMRAPAEKMQRSLARFRQLSGLETVGKGFGTISRTAKDAFLQVSRIVTPLGAITGAASLAGMYRLTESWATFGSRLGFAAQRIGISSDQLQSFDGAARLAGSSAESMQSGLQALGQNMWDAVGGRNPGFWAAANRMNLNWTVQGKRARSVAEVLPQIADYIRRLKSPYAQAAIAAEMFGSAGEDLLPVLRLGSAGLAAYQRQAVAYGVINARGVEAANRLRVAQMGVAQAVEGAGYAIAEKLEPTLTPLLQSLAQVIANNRNWIALKIGQYVGEFATWLKSIDWETVKQGVENVGAEFQSAVAWLGGWKTAAEVALAAIAALYAAPVLGGLARLAGALRLATSPVGLATAGVGFAYERGAADLPGAAWATLMAHMRNQKLDQAIRANIARHQGPLTKKQFDQEARESVGDFMKMGWTRPQADIITGNLAGESGLNPYRMDKAGAFGLAQWLGSRVDDFRTVEGVDLPYSTPHQQRDFINWELRHKESASGALLGVLTNEGDAPRFGRSYERYKLAEGHEAQRVAFARHFADLDLSTPAAEVGVPSRAAPAAGGAFGKLLVELHVHGAAAGVSAGARSRSPGVQIAGVKVHRAMASDVAAHGF